MVRKSSTLFKYFLTKIIWSTSVLGVVLKLYSEFINFNKIFIFFLFPVNLSMKSSPLTVVLNSIALFDLYRQYRHILFLGFLYITFRSIVQNTIFDCSI